MLNATAIIVTHTYIHIFNTHSPTSKCTTTKTTTIKKRERESARIVLNIKSWLATVCVMQE